MALTRSKETLPWETWEDRAKIREVEKTFQVRIPQKFIEEFGDMFISKKQALKIANGELKRFELEQLRVSMDSWVEKVWSDIDKSNKIENQWDKELEESWKNAEELWNKLKDTTKKIWGKTWETAKKAVTQVREKVEAWGFIAMVEQWKNSDIFLLKLLWSFLWFFTWFFNFWKKVEEGEEKAKEILWETERQLHEKTLWDNSEEIADAIGTRLGIHHPVLQEKIKTSIQNKEIFSDSLIIKLSEKIEAGEKIDIAFLEENLSAKEFNTLFFEITKDEEIKNALYLQFEKNLVSKIADEYNLHLNADKRTELSKLIKEKLWEKQAIAEVWRKFYDGEKTYLYEAIPALFDTGAQAVEFQVSLITRGIIGFSALALNIVDAWVKMIEIWMVWLWISGSLTLENFLKQIEKMDDWEKALIIWILYRKASIAWKIAWGILAKIVELSVETVSPTSIGFIESTKNMIWKTDSQLKSYNKLTQKLGLPEDDFLKTAKKALQQVATQTEIARILNQWEKTGKSTKDIAKNIWNLKWEIFDKDTINQAINAFDGNDIQTIRKNIASNITFKKDVFEWLDRAKTLYPWRSYYAEKFQQSLSQVSEWQKAKIRWTSLDKIFSSVPKSIRSALEQKELSFNFDKMVYESSDVRKCAKLSEDLARFAKQSPDQFRGMFWGLAEIAFIGLALGTMEKDESMSKVLLESLLYLPWIVWPWYMLVSINGMRNPETGEILWWNIAQAWAGWVLLTFDLVKSWHLLLRYGLKEGFRKIWTDVIAKLITSVWKAWIYSAKFVHNAGKFWMSLSREIAKWTFNWAKLWEKMMKWLKWRKWRIGFLLWGILAWGSAIAYTYEHRNDIGTEYEEMLEKWIIDKQWNLLDKEKARGFFQSEFSDPEKETFAWIILEQNKYAAIAWNIDIKVSWNTLEITPLQKWIWQWIIEPSQQQYLENLWLNIKFLPKINNFA